MKLVKIKNSEYVRDLNTNAVLNTNKQQILEFNEKRKQILNEKTEKEETKMRLAKLEEDMNEIKVLLMEIAQLRGKQCQ